MQCRYWPACGTTTKETSLRDEYLTEGECRVIQVGGQSRAEIVKALADAGVQLNVHAQTLLAHPAFDDPVVRTLRIVERSVSQLGLKVGAVQSRVFAAARDQGLELCPLVTGPYLRLTMKDQANAPDSLLSAGRGPRGALHVASDPLSENPEYPKGFYLRVVDGTAWLRGYRCDDEYVFTPGQRLAFHRPAGDVEDQVSTPVLLDSAGVRRRRARGTVRPGSPLKEQARRAAVRAQPPDVESPDGPEDQHGPGTRRRQAPRAPGKSAVVGPIDGPGTGVR